MRSFVKIKSSQNAKITLLFTNILKSWPSCKFLASQICLLTLFAKISGFYSNPNFTVTLHQSRNGKGVECLSL